MRTEMHVGLDVFPIQLSDFNKLFHDNLLLWLPTCAHFCNFVENAPKIA
jgi:hypothetical protein